MMSFRNRLLGVLDVILRVPPLFIMDELLCMSLGLSNPSFTSINDLDTGQLVNNSMMIEPSLNSTFNQSWMDSLEDVQITEQIVSRAITTVFIKFSACCLCYMAALCTFLLSTNQLLLVYMYLISVATVLVSYWSNLHMMKLVASETVSSSLLESMLTLNFQTLLKSDSVALPITINYVAQSAFEMAFRHLHLGPRHQLLDISLFISFTGPSILATLPLPHTILRHVPVFAALLPLLVVKYSLWNNVTVVCHFLYNSYVQTRTFIRNFGLHSLIENEWVRLNIPYVLRTFWVVRVVEQSVSLVATQIHVGNGQGWFSNEVMGEMIKHLLIRGSETVTAVLGLTSMVSCGCHYIGCLFQWVLLTDDEDDRSIGTVSAVLFFILALQTGITTLEPEKRFIRLCRNFCLLFTALLHFVHNIVNPLMMSLSASHNPYLHRHVRALFVCLFLIFFPIFLLCYLWTHHSVTTWLLAVSAFSVEVIVKVLVSLMIYVLFLIDAYRNSFWEKLDDYVYYIRSFGNTVEFCFGIFLFFNGAWILIFESGGTIRAIMMCIHAYFNIWCEAKAGWSVFMKRRTAVNKINSLPEASKEQLEHLNDVCAICYQEMQSAKITRCNHFFHSVCLRKWLYVQDRCPLCHEVLYKSEEVPVKVGAEHTNQLEQREE